MEKYFNFSPYQDRIVYHLFQLSQMQS
uniref:Uncharacterized protein n=1 Tax=Anguilla anguilla TaxID=7936 RepID=A0A0E9QCB7_ANGAN